MVGSTSSPLFLYSIVTTKRHVSSWSLSVPDNATRSARPTKLCRPVSFEAVDDPARSAATAVLMSSITMDQRAPRLSKFG